MDANSVIASATVASVVVAGVYAGLTYLLARKNGEMVALMEAQHREFIAPHVVIAVGIKHSIVTTIKVRNIGRSPARNVRLALNRDFYQFADYSAQKNLRNWPIFQKALPSLGVGDEIFFLLCRGADVDSIVDGINITPATFSITVTSEFAGAETSTVYPVDLTLYRRTGQDRPEELAELEKIRKSLEKLAAAK